MNVYTSNLRLSEDFYGEVSQGDVDHDEMGLLSMYMRSFENQPLLNSKALEVELIKKIRWLEEHLEEIENLHTRFKEEAALYRWYYNKEPSFLDLVTMLPDTKELRNLTKNYKAGVKAEKVLVKANLKLVIAVAKRHLNKGVSLLDLIQEGNIGLLTSIKKFDISKDVKFSTYATWWIKQAITRAIHDKSRTIRIPVHIGESLYKVKRTYTQLSEKLERTPTPEEVAAIVGIKPEKVSDILKLDTTPVSLDMPVADDERGGKTFIETIESDYAKDDVVDYLKTEARSDLLRSLRMTLDQKEYSMISMFYGLTGETPTRISEMAEMYNITKMRVSQIIKKGLKKLKDNFTVDDFIF